MSVYGIEGTPGSGKTLYAINEFILPALKTKKVPIYTNIEGLDFVKLSVIADITAVEAENLLFFIGGYDEQGKANVTVEAVRSFYKDLPLGALIVIDEAQNYFSARDFKEKFSSELIPYLSRHRHYGHTVVWITQQREAVDITFRRQTQYMYRLERLENFGLKNTSIVKMYEGWDSMLVPPFAKKNFSFPKKIYGVYKSYVSSAIEESRKSHNVFLSNKLFMGLITVMLLAIVYLIFFAESPFSTKATTKKTTALTSAPPTPAPTIVRGEGEGEMINDEVYIPCFTEKIVINGKSLYKLETGEFTTGGLISKCID